MGPGNAGTQRRRVIGPGDDRWSSRHPPLPVQMFAVIPPLE